VAEDPFDTVWELDAPIERVWPAILGGEGLARLVGARLGRGL
jgi:hypothetical protein